MLDRLNDGVEQGASHGEMRRPVLDEQRHHAHPRSEVERPLAQRIESRVRNHVIEAFFFKIRPQALRFRIIFHKGKPSA